MVVCPLGAVDVSGLVRYDGGSYALIKRSDSVAGELEYEEGQKQGGF